MEQLISNEELEKIKNIKGEVSGYCLKEDRNFILEKEGKEALERIEAAMENIGYPEKYKDIKSAEMYPMSMEIAQVIVIQKLLNYNEDDFEKMGRIEAKISSTIIRIFMRYFVSFKIAASNIQRMWSQHYSIGRVSIPQYDTKKRFAIYRIEDFKTHIFICQIMKGYIAASIQLLVGKNAIAQETKCVHKGDGYHEFLIKW